MTVVSLRTIDLLARLRLSTGARVVAAPDELWELLELCGLREALQANNPARSSTSRPSSAPAITTFPALDQERRVR